MNEMAFWRVMVTVNSLALAAALTAQTAVRKESLTARLLRIAGLTASPSQMRGLGDDDPGNIWVASLERRASRPLTTDGGYRSPVFSADARIYALNGEMVVRIPVEGGRAAPLQKASGALKLIGFDVADADAVVVLLETAVGGSPLASLSLKGGGMTPLPYDRTSEDDRRMLAQVRAQNRVYGDTAVYTMTEAKPGLSRTIEWTDVYIKRGAAAPRNVSSCNGVNCTQPALSPDGRSLVFVKARD
jgi:hypothetical protein